MRLRHRHPLRPVRLCLRASECRSAANQFFSVRVQLCRDKGKDRDKVRARGKMLLEPTVRRFVRANVAARIPRARDLRESVRHLEQEAA